MSVREEIRQFLGCPIISVFGSQAAKQLDFSNNDVGVVLIGHGAPWEERSQLISRFKQALPATPVIASLRQTHKPFLNADFNCPADNPPEWVDWSSKHLRVSIDGSFINFDREVFGRTVGCCTVNP